MLALHNKITGKTTKKFASRAKGIEQTFRAQKDDGSTAAPKKTTGKAKPGRKLGLTFRLPPAEDGASDPRSGSAREKAFGALKGARGGTFKGVMKAAGWNRKKAYEGIRLLNLHNGFGIWSEPLEGDDYRIRFVDIGEFRRLEKAAA